MGDVLRSHLTRGNVQVGGVLALLSLIVFVSGITFDSEPLEGQPWEEILQSSQAQSLSERLPSMGSEELASELATLFSLDETQTGMVAGHLAQLGDEDLAIFKSVAAEALEENDVRELFLAFLAAALADLGGHEDPLDGKAWQSVLSPGQAKQLARDLPDMDRLAVAQAFAELLGLAEGTGELLAEDLANLSDEQFLLLKEAITLSLIHI